MHLLFNLMCLIMLQGGRGGSSQNMETQPPEMPPRVETDTKLPNGKSQNEAILKAEYQKTLQDAARLVALSRSLQRELQRTDSHVLSYNSLKKAEEIEKTAKQIHDRLKH